MFKRNIAFIALCMAMPPQLGNAQFRATDTEPIESSAPQRRMENGIAFLCGGVGEDEARVMKDAVSAYDLLLTFAAKDGAYLADVRVDIADGSGRPVMEAHCDGPMMLVDLPPGAYRVRAEVNGRMLTRTVHIGQQDREGNGPARMVMAWPRAAADDRSSGGTRAPAGASGKDEEAFPPAMKY